MAELLSSPAVLTRLSRRMWFTILILVSLSLAFVYSVAVLIEQWTPPEQYTAVSSGAATLEALLFQQGTKLALYSVATPQGTVRAAQAITDARELAFPPRLLSTRAVLISTDQGARVRDIGSPYTYDPLNGRKSPLVALSRNTNFTFSITGRERQQHLTVTFNGCGEIADIPLPERKSWYVPHRLFETLSLPEQRRMVLSPAETSLVLLDHTSSPRLILIDLIERTALELIAPSYDPEQLHFSPLFLDEETLLFSVIDRDHWGTVLYHIADGRYEPFSTTFTDRAYHSTSGKLVLVQSFYDNTVNIPFGSTALRERLRAIPLKLVENIVGPIQSQEAAEIRTLLFQTPEGNLLNFRRDLSSSSFNAIEDPLIREQLRTLWLSHRAEVQTASGIFRILSGGSPHSLTTAATVPFDLSPPQTSAEYTNDVEPLLQALELPPSLLQEYRKRSANAKKAGEAYILVDAM